MKVSYMFVEIFIICKFTQKGYLIKRKKKKMMHISRILY